MVLAVELSMGSPSIPKLHQERLLQGEECLDAVRCGAEELVSRSQMFCPKVRLVLEKTTTKKGFEARRDSLPKF